MDVTDSMEVTEPTTTTVQATESTPVVPTNKNIDGDGHGKWFEHDATNENAMQNLSLEPGEVSSGSPVYQGFSGSSSEGDAIDEPNEGDSRLEAEKLTSGGKTTEPAGGDQEENAVTMTALADKVTAPDAMEEDPSIVPSTTESSVTPPLDVPSTCGEPTTVNQTTSPEPTAMEEDIQPEINTDVNTKVVDELDGWGLTKGKGRAEPTTTKEVDDSLDLWGLAKEKSGTEESAEDNGWGVTSKSTKAKIPGWDDGTDIGGGSSIIVSNTWGTNSTNGDSGFRSGQGSGVGGGGWGSKGRNRDSYRGNDSFKRQRPLSFGSGFDNERDRRGASFVSGSNAELLPPLGRSSAKMGDRHARLVRAAPYPPRGRGGRILDSSAGFEYENSGLDYGGNSDGNDVVGCGGGGFDGTVALSHKPVVLKEVDTGGLDTLSKIMSNADIKSITKAVMDHIGRIQKLRNENADAHALIRQCGAAYEEQKRDLKAQLESCSPLSRTSISSKLERHRTKGKMEENLLEAMVFNTETALKREVEALVCTVSEALANRIHTCLLDIVKAVSNNGGRGAVCDVEAVVERCVVMAAPKLLRDQLGNQEKTQRALERRVEQLDESLQERDKTIIDLNRRLKRLEQKLKPDDLMVTDPGKTTSRSEIDSAPEVSSGSCQHQ